MKIIKREFVLGVLFLISLTVQAQKSDIRVYTLSLTAQDNPLGGNMVDLDRRKVYPLQEAGYYPKRIDFGFMYGSNTGGNLMAPISQGFLTFGNKFKDALLSWGNDRNNGTFVNVGNGEEAQRVFAQIQTAEAIETLHNEWADKVMDYTDYNPGKHGPGQRTRPISIGDVIFFRSENKNTHHVFRVTKFVQSRTGLLELEVKSPKNVKKK